MRGVIRSLSVFVLLSRPVTLVGMLTFSTLQTPCAREDASRRWLPLRSICILSEHKAHGGANVSCVATEFALFRKNLCIQILTLCCTFTRTQVFVFLPKPCLLNSLDFQSCRQPRKSHQPLDLSALVDASWEDAFHSQDQSSVKFTNVVSHEDSVPIFFLKELAEMEHLLQRETTNKSLMCQCLQHLKRICSRPRRCKLIDATRSCLGMCSRWQIWLSSLLDV